MIAQCVKYMQWFAACFELLLLHFLKVVKKSTYLVVGVIAPRGVRGGLWVASHCW
jgi:hypothetical protein